MSTDIVTGQPRVEMSRQALQQIIAERQSKIVEILDRDVEWQEAKTVEVIYILEFSSVKVVIDNVNQNVRIFQKASGVIDYDLSYPMLVEAGEISLNTGEKLESIGAVLSTLTGGHVKALMLPTKALERGVRITAAGEIVAAELDKLIISWVESSPESFIRHLSGVDFAKPTTDLLAEGHCHPNLPLGDLSDPHIEVSIADLVELVATNIHHQKTLPEVIYNRKSHQLFTIFIKEEYMGKLPDLHAELEIGWQKRNQLSEQTLRDWKRKYFDIEVKQL